MKSKSSENNLYDYFNVWFAFLLNPLKPDRDPEKIVSEMTMDLHKEYDGLISKIDSFCESGQKEVCYQKGKKHIRFSNLTYHFNLKEEFIDLQAKIRINPCILSSDSKAHHTKIWVIFYNEEPQHLTSKDLLTIRNELEHVATRIKSFILQIANKYFNKKCEDSIYKIKMLNSSLHPSIDAKYDTELNQLYVIDKNEATLEYFKHRADEFPFTRNFFEDLFMLNDIDDHQNVGKHLYSRKDKISWKIINSRYYNTICRVASEEDETSITSLYSIKEDKNRDQYLYTEPLKKAIDMSESL